MFYIHDISCISAQQTFSGVDLETLKESVENKLTAIQPVYEGIPPGILRRMGKAVKMSVGAALPLLKNTPNIHGIIIGTANGGMEDCIKFMNQIVQYDEGMLTPGNFVQSTPNGIAAQIALLKNNKSYNITHVHRGLSFENAAIDAAMQLKENPGNTYLLGATDEISSYNYNVDLLAGWYKKETVSNKDLYTVDSPASIAGEGSAMFLVNSNKDNAVSQLAGLSTLHSEDVNTVTAHLENFIQKHLNGVQPGIFITGENGDNRLTHFYSAAEKVVGETTPVVRFKHMSGEYPTASAQAVWLASHIIKTGAVPAHMIKSGTLKKEIKTVLIYNNYQGKQHGFMVVGKPVR